MTRVQLQNRDSVFFYGASLIALSVLALGFVLMSWAVGGTGFKNSFHGDVVILLCVAGIAAGGLLTHLARPDSEK